MKLIGSYTSPFVRKISVMLLEKGIAFEFVNDPPYEPGSRVVELNPLAKVPVLVAEDGAVFYDSRVIAEYLELLSVAPAFLPADRAAALRIRQVEALVELDVFRQNRALLTGNAYTKVQIVRKVRLVR